MNPPSAIHGAMSRDRKPFTYTPGGLDLSEIKSERMAKRLMRNAMNQGISEVAVQSIKSPPMPSSPVIVPNFNCLPVQVFPTFNLPANPKSLLRTRSNPDHPRDPLGQKNAQNQFQKPNKFSIRNHQQSDLPTNTQINNNRPASMYEYNSYPSNNFCEQTSNHNGTKCVDPTLPEISYDAEYLKMLPMTNQIINDITLNTETNTNNDRKLFDTLIDVPFKPLSETNLDIVHHIAKPVEDETGNKTQREVKVKKTVKKEQRTEEKRTAEQRTEEQNTKEERAEEQSTKNKKAAEQDIKEKRVEEQKTKEQNGNHNGDIEAELTVKLPTKKTGAKIETKVEVEKKILPDGTVEEVTTTTTKTTVDGKTDIKTKIETRILPEDEVDEIEEEIEEEEEEEQEDTNVVTQDGDDEIEEQIITEQESLISKPGGITVKENGQVERVMKTEQKTETTTTTTKKVVVVQSDNEETEEVEEEEIEEEEEEEEVEETKPVTTVSKKKTEKLSTPPPEVTEVIADEDDAEEREEKSLGLKKYEVSDKVEDSQEKINIDAEGEQGVELEKVEDSAKTEQVIESKIETKLDQDEEEFEEAEDTEIKKVDEKENKNINVTEPDVVQKEEVKPIVTEEYIPIKTELRQDEYIKPDINNDEKEVFENKKNEQASLTETKIPLREPSIPLEKIEDIEIKPIGPPGVITKTHTEKTEIITSTSDQPAGVHSTQTEYNRIENIVTVNRTTKTLDNNYENLTQREIPTVKTYFTPSRILSSPMPSSPYQPVYPPASTERRHSLLLDRLSQDRQMPSEIYHNQTYEQQRQMSQEPQSEVLTISNVKPSKIANQQWYQQSKETVYNNATPIPLSSDTQSWTQPQPKVQPQPTYTLQPTYPLQQTYQPQQSYLSQQSYQPQQAYQQPLPSQQTYQPQQSYPPQSTPLPQYQPSYTEPVQTNKYSTFTPKSVNRVSSLDTTPSFNASSNLYSFNNESSEAYQKSTQQYSSSYVPPPWEQDSSYIPDYNQNYYQPPATGTLNTTPTPAQSWKPTLPKGKFSKPPPTAYIPPAPNQSFVKPVSSAEPSRQSGRKTYYSEYERRYISVPESTYIPQETKFQPQPDPSPKYYYDNNESNESVEHEWRKELREFTEKTSQTPTQSEQANVKPPWESDPKYVKSTDLPYTPTPTWSQTVRPRSWRERSFESEYVGSQEWPKTNTLGRGRPLASYNKPEPILERTRGVSVDRYNPTSYKPPTSLEHPPVQTHTLPTPAPHGTYHNPNVPAYHSRASEETREQPVSYKQPCAIRDQRASPFQSRSFKYLQWITGTED